MLVLEHEAGHQVARVAQLVLEDIVGVERARGGAVVGGPVQRRVTAGGTRVAEGRGDRVGLDVAAADAGDQRQVQLVAGLEIHPELADPTVVLAVVTGRGNRGDRIRVRAGGGGHVVASGGDLGLLDQAGDAADASGDAQTAVHEDIGIIDRGGRQELLVVAAFLPPRLLAVPQPGMGVAANRNRQPAAAGIEGALGADVDGAGRCIGIHVGTGGLVDVDRVHAGQGRLLEAEGARGRGVGIDTRQADAIEGDPGVLGWQPAQGDVARRIVGDDVKVHAGHVLEELSRVAVGDLAEAVGRERVGDVHRGTLFHDRARIAFAYADHLHRIHCYRRLALAGGAEQLDQQLAGLPGLHRDLFFHRGKAGELHAQPLFSDGQAGDAELATVTGKGNLAAVDLDPRIAQVLAGGRVQHLAQDGAGSGGAVRCRRSGRGRRRRTGMGINRGGQRKDNGAGQGGAGQGGAGQGLHGHSISRQWGSHRSTQPARSRPGRFRRRRSGRASGGKVPTDARGVCRWRRHPRPWP